MRAGLLPKLLLSPSTILVLVCVYGYIMFTVYLSFTSSTMMPSYEWTGSANYSRLIGLENWAVSLSNLWVFASLYIVFAMAIGLALAIYKLAKTHKFDNETAQFSKPIKRL